MPEEQMRRPLLAKSGWVNARGYQQWYVSYFAEGCGAARRTGMLCQLHQVDVMDVGLPLARGFQVQSVKLVPD